MATRTTFPLSSIVAVSLFTIVAVPSVALAQVAAQERVVAACTSDVRGFCGQSHDERQACIKTRFKGIVPGTSESIARVFRRVAGV